VRETDIAIVGAGLAGSLAAVMLGRAGHAAGEWNSFHSMAVDPMGNIYTSEVTGRPASMRPPRLLR